MKLETLKKNNKKKILIGGLIVFALISVIGFTTTRAKYKSIQNLKLAIGTNNWKQYDFKVMAMYKSENGTNYSEITTMPGSNYVVNEDKSYCTTNNTTKVKGKIKTIDGHHVIENLQKSDKCYIWFDYVPPITSSTIIANSNYKTTAPTFSNVATTNEGVYRTTDGMYSGYSYYWRGASTTNHVIFADKCWRIVRINGDGSIRLIYNGAQASAGKCAVNGSGATIMGSSNAEKYYATSDGQSNKSYYVGWTYGTGQRTTGGTASNAKTQTEKWYNTNIGNNTTYVSKVADGYFCNDRNVTAAPSNWSGYTTTWSVSGTQFAYAGAKRLNESYAPKLSCPNGDKYTLKVGAITADEVVMAGGKCGTGNSSYYLYTGQNYWTVSPHYWSGSAYVFYVNANGQLGDSGVHNTAVGLRPVINLKPETTFATGGNGTMDKPYIVQ